MSVYKKLNAARWKLQNTELKKSGHNKFAGYKYFELGDFLPTINGIFSDAGLCGVVSFDSELATLTITDVDDGSQIVITSPMGSAALKGCHEVQNIGAVETYQRRYLWVTAMEIVEHDALDSVTGASSGEPVKLEDIKFYVDKINSAKNMAQLEVLYKDAIQDVKSSPAHKSAVVKATNEMKSLFEESVNE